MFDLTQSDFAYIRDLVRRDSGVILEAGKEYLVASNLQRVCEEAGLPGIAELLGLLRRQPLNDLRRVTVQAMMIRETSFFRDPGHFASIRKAVLPELVARRRSNRRLRIWSAAASSGQEAYSIAVMLRDAFPETNDWSVEIVASDIDPDMVKRCREGIYSDYETSRGLPCDLRRKYFEPHASGWQAIPGLRKVMNCQCLNLSAGWSGLPRMDLVLMRNVLIYFDPARRTSVLWRAAELLAPDGYLMMGSTEAPPQRLMKRLQGIGDHGVMCYRRLGLERADLAATIN